MNDNPELSKNENVALRKNLQHLKREAKCTVALFFETWLHDFVFMFCSPDVCERLERRRSWPNSRKEQERRNRPRWQEELVYTEWCVWWNDTSRGDCTSKACGNQTESRPYMLWSHFKYSGYEIVFVKYCHRSVLQSVTDYWNGLMSTIIK